MSQPTRFRKRGGWGVVRHCCKDASEVLAGKIGKGEVVGLPLRGGEVDVEAEVVHVEGRYENRRCSPDINIQNLES
jgi:hypothetical protein